LIFLMTVVITCGPAFEPIDEMRRLTNASTGRLGSLLAESFTTAGHEVLLLRAEGSTAALPTGRVEVSRFGTNDDLARQLREVSQRRSIDAVLHAAALCDFKVTAIRNAHQADLRGAKVSSRAGLLTLELQPATKVLPQLKEWFPKARIVGWKFELTGSRQDALRAAERQFAEAGTDACVLNGRAWGQGFGLRDRSGALQECADATALAGALLAWLASTTPHR
jgi:phosphopantothenoylcysteine decarboxylase/phosphopantothenate--cysteine ligase